MSRQNFGTAPSAVYFLLLLPKGVVSGYISIALGYRLAQAGVSTEAYTAMLGFAFVPLTTQFLLAPFVDVLLTPKTWYTISAVACASGVCALATLPATHSNMPWFQALSFNCGIALTGINISVSRLMAHGTDINAKGRAAGWSEAGGVGGTALGGGLGLWLAQHLAQPPLAGCIMAATNLACTLALSQVQNPEISKHARSLRPRIAELFQDVWRIVRVAPGRGAVLLCLLPVGTGAATSIWAAVASDWHAPANVVALSSGIGNGMAAGAGALLGGYVSDRFDRKLSYIVFCLLQAACLVSMALAPSIPQCFVVFAAAYSFTWGMAFAGLSAVILEAIGRGAAATKYTFMASLANIPLGLMIFVDGWVRTYLNAKLMLFCEASIGIGAICILGLLGKLLPPQPPNAG